MALNALLEVGSAAGERDSEDAADTCRATIDDSEFLCWKDAPRLMRSDSGVAAET